jgi:hypothetical protein
MDSYLRAVVSAGQTNPFVNLTEPEPTSTDAARTCWSATTQGIDSFANCWVEQKLNVRERRILICAQTMVSTASAALCSVQDDLSPDLYAVANCTSEFAESNQGNQFIECLSSRAMRNLSNEQKAIFQCSIGATDIQAVATCVGANTIPANYRVLAQCAMGAKTYQDVAGCAANQYLNADQARVVNCFVNNTGDYIAMGICAAGPHLTPEQRAAATCAVSTSGVPLPFAACFSTQLTVNEIKKCFEVGIGGPNGCFGPNNTAVKAIDNAWHDATRGPGPNNTVAVFMRNAQNDLRYGPGRNNDVVGRDGFVCKKLLFGICR